MTTHKIAADELDDQQYWVNAKVAVRVAWLGGAVHSLGFSPQGRPGRREYGGELVDDLFGWLNRDSTVIAAVHIPDTRRVITVDDGDEITVEGHGTFRLERGARLIDRDRVLVHVA